MCIVFPSVSLDNDNEKRNGRVAAYNTRGNGGMSFADTSKDHRSWYTYGYAIHSYPVRMRWRQRRGDEPNVQGEA
ncbi:hypothetical protein J2T17_000117 [Paenibacillus mucilaginosus]